MAKITKARARRLLKQAAEKLNKVMFIPDLTGAGKLSTKDNNELSRIWSKLVGMSEKLK